MNLKAPTSELFIIKITTADFYLMLGLKVKIEKLIHQFSNVINYVIIDDHESLDVPLGNEFHIIDFDSLPYPNKHTLGFMLSFKKTNKKIRGGNKPINYINLISVDELQSLTNMLKISFLYNLPLNGFIGSSIKLTGCQYEMLNLMLRGFTLKEISWIKNISIKTAYGHRKLIFKKLGVKSMEELYLKRKKQKTISF